MSETGEKPVVADKGSQRRIACLAITAIAVSGGFIWHQIPAFQRNHFQVPPRSGSQALQGSGSGVKRSSPLLEFDVKNATIPVEQIRSGGPEKDGIPSLANAEFVSADAAPFLLPEDRVIGVAIADQAKAYPLKILNYHEAVNDRLAGRSFVVTYCPLCDSAAVFDRRFGDQEYEFGISGLLFNSNVLFYDRDPAGQESLWSQMASSAVVGSKSGQSLQRLPLELTTWSDWAERHPETLVLSDETGHQRSYHKQPYQRYFANDRLMFSVDPLDERLPAKSRVLGIMSPESQRVYRLASFGEGEDCRVVEQLDGLEFTLVYNAKHDSLRVEGAEEGLQWMYSFWFAWAAFYPEIEIYLPSEESSEARPEEPNPGT